jgi:hypothetical protein
MIRKAASLGLSLMMAIVPALNFHLHPALAQEKSELPTKPVFHCLNNSQGTPTTFVWVPELKGNIALITWQSEFFAPREKLPERCQTVTDKFQKAYQQDQLEYLTTGKVNKYNVVCGVKKRGDDCNGDNQLFTLNPAKDPAETLQKLINVMQGKDPNSILEGGGGDDGYFEVKNLFNSAKVVNRNPPKWKRTAGYLMRRKKIVCKMGTAGAPAKCPPKRIQSAGD